MTVFDGRLLYGRSACFAPGTSLNPKVQVMNDATAAESDPTFTAATLEENGFASAPNEHDCIAPADTSQNGKEDHLHQILAAVVAFRDGDFSVRLPLSWTGIEGRIAEVLNQTRQGRPAQAAAVVAACHGRLDRQGKRHQYAD
jgi:hypothetical protein